MRFTLSVFVYFYITVTGFAQYNNVWNRPEQTERERYFDVLHYSLDLEFDLDSKSFEGTNTISLKPLHNNFSKLSLDAVEIEILKVETSRDNILGFVQDSAAVHISLDRIYSKGEDIDIKVFYRGKDLSDGLFFHDETDQYPKMVESNSWPNHARYWFPCYDYPNDKATQEIIISVDSKYKVISNGELLDVNRQGDKVRYHWFLKKPHSTYLSMLSIAPFSVLEDSLGSLPVNYWVFSGDEENALRVFSLTPEIIDFFNKTYAYQYPWSKYDQVIGPRQGGGAEATSATILGTGVIHDEDPEKDKNWKRIIAHEIAHQWWGDLITLRTWSETWMNESFGTYSDYLYTEHFLGEPDASIDLKGKKDSYLDEAKNRYSRPIVFTRYNRPQDNFDRHTYQKGASVLNMLRSLLGAEKFYSTLSHFLHRYEFKAVETGDFIEVAEEITGMDLGWFFEQWIYKPGHPVFEISKKWDKVSGELSMYVNQVQDTINGTPVFKMPLTIGIYNHGADPVLKEVWLEKRDESFTWKLDREPDMVRFDVGNILLKEWTYNKEADELIYQAENDDVIGKIWAIEQLGKHFKGPLNKDLTLLMERLTIEDDMWPVRVAALDCLHSSNQGVREDILQKALDDKHYSVRNKAREISK
ncbi:MAG: M1 family metallopeptidase [Marinilabiliaceae bacterium]|nr:M1 family metallopeptidase [Marinilabiliaceae bacterium]